MATDLRERIIDLARRAPPASLARIAREAGCTAWTVSAVLRDARGLGIAIARRPRRPAGPGEPIDLRLPADVLRTLRSAAEGRDTDVTVLAKRLVCTAARGGLIDAILDDGGQRGDENA